MDEPFAALDALTRRKMQDELLQLWDDTHFTVLFVTHSIAEAIKIGNRILLLSPHPGPGQGGDQQPAARRRGERCGARRSRTGSTACCSPMRSRPRRPLMSDTAFARAGTCSANTVDATQFGVVEKPLSTWERIYNIAAVRKVAILVILALDLGGLRALAQQSAAVSDLRRPRSRRSTRRIFGGGLLGKAWTSIKVLLIGYSAGIALAALLTVIAHQLAHRHRFPRDADLDVQSVAGHRAAAAGADLVRPGQRQPGVRADPFGAVGGRAQHAFRVSVGVQYDAHGRAQLRLARSVAMSRRS